jgi:hypothetical protein
MQLEGNIIEVGPQSFIKFYGRKASKPDGKIATDANEEIDFEIQVLYDAFFGKRKWVTSASVILSNAPSGGTYKEKQSDTNVESSTLSAEKLVVKIPKIIRINLLCYNILESSESEAIVQPVQFLYTNAPNVVADDTITEFNVQMPRFVELLEKGEIDYSNKLHVWLFIIWKSHELKKTPREVVDMYTQVQPAVNSDLGLQQYVNRVSSISVDPTALREYSNWFREVYSHQGEIVGAVEEERDYWQGVVTDKDTALAKEKAALAQEKAALAQKDAELKRIAEEFAAYRAQHQ